MACEVLYPALIPAFIKATIRADKVDQRIEWCRKHFGKPIEPGNLDGAWYNSGQFFFFTDETNAKRFMLASAVHHADVGVCAAPMLHELLSVAFE